MGNLKGLRNEDASQPFAAERRERLEYLADLLGELQTLAQQEACVKLPYLIALSRAEAIEESLKSAP